MIVKEESLCRVPLNIPWRCQFCAVNADPLNMNHNQTWHRPKYVVKFVYIFLFWGWPALAGCRWLGLPTKKPMTFCVTRKWFQSDLGIFREWQLPFLIEFWWHKKNLCVSRLYLVILRPRPVLWETICCATQFFLGGRVWVDDVRRNSGCPLLIWMASMFTKHQGVLPNKFQQGWNLVLF